VLVVDDERNMRRSLQTMLADEGYEVRAAESAEEALGLLAQGPFFMVITDARLGGMSGYEFLSKARVRWPDLPILMITAYATPKLAVEAIRSGAIDYLPKPFAPEELLHAVARCAERYRLLQENAGLRARATQTWGLEQIVGDCQKMREAGIMQIVAVTDPLQVGFRSQAMVGIRADGDAREVADRLAAVDDIDYVVMVAGEYDILVELVCEDEDRLLDLLNGVIRQIPGVRETEMFMYLKLKKQTYTWGTR